MRIAVLAWGSLYWDLNELAIKDKWFEDGPFLPIEFARISNDGRLTLVIYKSGTKVRTYWSLMDTEELENAVDNLAEREGCPKDRIGIWNTVEGLNRARDQEVLNVIGIWARSMDVDAVIWTDLAPNFEETKYKSFSHKSVLAHLEGLDNVKRQKAAEYILRAPAHTQTTMRAKLESWAHQASRSSTEYHEEI